MTMEIFFRFQITRENILYVFFFFFFFWKKRLETDEKRVYLFKNIHKEYFYNN